MTSCNKFFLFCGYFIIFVIGCSESAKILAIFPFPGRSQYLLVQPYLQTLAARGHELTAINAYPSAENGANYRDIPVMEVHQIQEDYIKGSLIHRNIWSSFSFVSDFVCNVTRAVLRNHQVQQLLITERFDLLIMEADNTEAMYSLGPLLGVPIIGVLSTGSNLIVDEMMGNPTPFAYISSMATGYTETMTYWQRLENVMVQLLQLLHHRWIHLPRQQELLHLYGPQVKEDVWTLRKNISLYLLNQHFALTFPRPNVPNMIEVGGFQIPSEPKALPAALRSVIDNSPTDIIYFSMGSNMKSKDFPSETLEIFIQVFTQLPYTILWKFENPELPGKPYNVHIDPWFPQTDILAEAKVKLFISHGGLLSTFEAVHYGKPMLGFPLFFDQHLNVNNAQRQGFALRLDVATLSSEEVRLTILEMMSNKSYALKAKEMSERYHDRPMKSLDLAVYWTEYVLRHRGALHLRSPAQQMDLLQSHSVDTVGAVVLGMILVLGFIIWLILKMSRVVCVPFTFKEKIN